MSPYMTIPEFSEYSGIPKNTIRKAVAGQYRHRICVWNGKQGSTCYIIVKKFEELWEQGRLV